VEVWIEAGSADKAKSRYRPINVEMELPFIKLELVNRVAAEKRLKFETQRSGGKKVTEKAPHCLCVMVRTEVMNFGQKLQEMRGKSVLLGCKKKQWRLHWISKM